MIAPPGRVHALSGRGSRTAGFHGKQRGDMHAVFHSMGCSDWATPLSFFFFLLTHPPLSLLPSPRTVPTTICPSTLPLWFSSVARLCRLLCLEPLEHTVKAQTVAGAGFRAFCSISDSPPPSLSPLTARPCSLAAPALFVFSHGLLSQPQVSLIINDPEGGGPLVALKVLDLAA